MHIRHRTTYRFSAPVFLDPHTLRLHPRASAGLALAAYRLDVSGARPRWHLDADGNTVARCWFQGRTDALVIEAEMDLVAHDASPLDFLLDAGATDLPVVYPARETPVLAAALRRATPPAGDPVAALAVEARRSSGGGTVAFLTALARAVQERVRYTRRERGDPLPPAGTLARGEGACRDLAVLFMDACRAQGLATRFVSGYLCAPDRPEPHDLHAWAEVYLPGAGWRGFDPSRGLAAGASHVPLAAAVAPAGAAPVAGCYRGSARSTLEVSLQIVAGDGTSGQGEQ